jgi:hypothetical protein
MKTNFLVVRVDPREKQGVKTLAERELRSMSDVVREMIREKLKEKGFPDLALIDVQEIQKTGG